MHLLFGNKEFSIFKANQKIKDKPSLIENELINKAVKYVKYIKWVPGIKMVAIGNSVAMNSADKNSDIDLFIVSSQHRLWIVRILVTFIFLSLGVRKTKNNHSGRFCLSFFCTTNVLNFENISIVNDIYLYFWIIYLKPLLNYDNTWEFFIDENRKWCDFNLYNNIIENNKNYISYSKISKKADFKILNFFETILKKVFITKTKNKFKSLGKPFGVIIDDNMLKFHDKDKRMEIRDNLIPH